MGITKLNDISKVTTASPETFLALAGKINLGNKMLAGLEVGTSTFYGKGRSTSTPYLEVYPDMGIDGSYCSFYGANRENNLRFTNLSEAMKAYNETILAHAQSPEQAQEYLIRNVPKESPDLKEAYVKSDFSYRPQMKSCMVLSESVSKTNPNENTVLLLDKDEGFAVIEGVTRDRFGNLDFSNMALPCSKFDIKDLQEGLDEFAIRSKSEVIYGTNEVKEQIEASKEAETENITNQKVEKDVNDDYER